MKTINFEQLEQLRKSGKEFLLLNVLPAEKFNEAHIPNSVNIPLKQADFVAQVEKAAGSKDKKIVTYCASYECPASHDAAEKLETSKFTDVSAYEGGIKEWQEKVDKRQNAA